ncbi:MAG: hypothetical protein KF812_03680 [Fimbriimonadaceae bacterium]|nr:hypothetical protein [Fimbriimonadaceae bacterium]
MDGLDPSAIRDVLETASQGGFRFVRVRQGKDEFEAVIAPSITVADEEEEFDDVESTNGVAEAKTKLVNSGHVGQLKWVDGIEPGVSVHEGDRLGEITALGISNEIVSAMSGQIATVFEPNGATVDFGRVLLEVTVE